MSTMPDAMEKVVDHSEDSGFDSIISGESNTAVKDDHKTIGEGINFVDPSLIEEEK